MTILKAISNPLFCAALCGFLGATLCGAAPARSLGEATPTGDRTSRSVPAVTGSVHEIRIENLEGLILVRVTLHGAAMDTSGWLVLDTGAGYLALDYDLSRQLGIVDSDTHHESLELADRPLRRLNLGGIQMDQVGPVLVFDAEVVRSVTDRPVLGLIGERVFRGLAARLDYGDRTLTLVPVPPGPGAGADEPPIDRVRQSRAALGGSLPSTALAVPYDRTEEGKMLVTAFVSNPKPPRRSRSLRLVLDTGATKSVLFASRVDDAAPRHRDWPSLRGLTAPTLMGSAEAWLARVPRLEVAGHERSIGASQIDVAVIEGELGALLEREVGEPVDGLLGYSFLRRFRSTIDFENRVLWLEPVPHAYDDRPHEYSHVGVQIERRDRELRVTGIAKGSPADVAGIARGDEIVSIDGRDARTNDLLEVTRSLEGPPGSRVRLRLRRGSEERTVDLVRRRLL